MRTKPTYQRYRNSSVEWLGEIPAHWDVRKLKHISSVQFSSVDKHTLEGETSVRLCNYVDVYYNDFITEGIAFMEATAMPAEIEKFTIKEGDVLVTKDSESWDDIAVSAYVSEDIPEVLCGYHLAQIRPNPKRVNGKYLFRAFKSRGINDQFRVEATGITRYGLGKYWLDNGLFPVPTINEQRAIANFLDQETVRIDALIEKKERQIELLREKCSALISHAVTKGLNPNVKLKDSGIEWLGEIPEHWVVAPLYARYHVQLGKMLDSKRITGERLAPYLRNVDIQWGKINTDDLPMMDFSSNDRDKFGLLKDDLLVCEGGEVGRTAVWIGEIQECYYQKALHRLRPLCNEDSSHFFHYVMFAASCIGVFKAGSDQSTIGHLTAEKFKWHRFAFPPKKEQEEIESYLDDYITKIELVAHRVLDSINKLREYRTALVSAAVTGKIDVRAERIETQRQREVPERFKLEVLTAEIISQLHKEPTFGRVKFQKILYLCENHLGMDIGGTYYRQAAGPLDNRMLPSVEKMLKRSKWFMAESDGQRIVYKPMQNAGDHKKYFDNYWNEYLNDLNSLLVLLKTANTRQCEIIATLFAAWNDLIISGASFTDDDIIQEVRANWHESKERFEPNQLRIALKWMREKGLVPKGYGKPTLVKS